jgi:hypothetical protein
VEDLAKEKPVRMNNKHMLVLGAQAKVKELGLVMP